MDPDPDPDWSPASNAGSGSGSNEYGSETLLYILIFNAILYCTFLIKVDEFKPSG